MLNFIISMIQAKTSMFVIQNYGTLTIINGTLSNINKNAYSLSTSDYLYVGSNGAMFTLNSVLQNSSYSGFTSSISNVTFDTIYSKEGGAFYFGSSSNIQNVQSNTITMNSMIIQNSFAYSNGLLSFISGYQYVLITRSLFQSNTGVKWEADLYVKQFGSLEIFNSTFTLFSISNSSDSIGQSITISMSTSKTLSFKLTSVTFKWSSTAFDKTTYKTYLSGDVALTKASPIMFISGDLITTNCTFSNWFSSKNGGVMFINANTNYTDTGSTFTQNAATTGGALYLVQTNVSLTNTIFTYNYANNGGAISAVSSSKIQKFNGVNCNYNYAYTGGWLYSKGESFAIIDSSKFSYNIASEASSVIYFFGTNPSFISNSEISNNDCNGKYTIALLFANMTITGIIVKDNTADEVSNGIFIAFSNVIIDNSIFNTITFPNNTKTPIEASDYSYLAGWYISVSSEAIIKITNTSFQNGYSNYGGAIYISGTSDVTLSSWNFTTWTSYYFGGAVYASGFLTLTINSCNFFNNYWYSSGCDLYLNLGGKTTLNRTKFNFHEISSIYVYGGYFYASNILMTTKFN